MASDALLEQPLYSIAEASRLLRTHPTTLRWWLHGKVTPEGRVHSPVLRAPGQFSHWVTWGEFVEATFLMLYRVVRRVRLDDIRDYIATQREQGMPYPLAHRRPFTAERALVVDYEIVGGKRAGQRTFPSDAFLDRIEFDNDVAVRFYPNGIGTPVMIDPRVQFGIPNIRGIRTEVVVGALDAGESADYVLSTWGLTPVELEAAVAYERSEVLV